MFRVQAVVLVLSMTMYASCQAGPKRGRYNYYEDELMRSSHELIFFRFLFVKKSLLVGELLISSVPPGNSLVSASDP